MGRKVLKKVNVDEVTYQTIMEMARKANLSVPVLLRFLLVNGIPFESLVKNTNTQSTQKVREKLPLPEALDRALKEAEREIERERREKEKPVRTEEKKEQEKPRRIVGDDPKKFFAKKLGIPYFDDKDE